ncbi:PilC/PilY family type IV pilus protein [soil metagenome]
MNMLMTRVRWFGAGLLTAMFSAAPAIGDDTEIFVSNADSSVRPNILFILDTSGSMDSFVDTQPPYDPATQYNGSCDSGRVYWSQGFNLPPTCGQNRWFNRSWLHCNAALQSFQSPGYWYGRAGQFNTGNNKWRRIETWAKSRHVECEADSGIHGETSGSSARWARDGKNGPWTTNPNQEINWGAKGNKAVRLYTLFDGNWMNWYYDTYLVQKTRLDVMKEVTGDLLDSISGVNVGLMRFSNNGGSTYETTAEGGMVVWPMENVETARTGMKAKIDSFKAQGNTPLSETLYEAGQYLAGRAVDYGNSSRGNDYQWEPSVYGSRVPGNGSTYQTPLEFSCQKNFVVLLTDGAPTADKSADPKIRNLPGFTSLVGADCDGSGNGRCLDDMAEYLYEADLVSSAAEQQNVVTYTIGFTVDLPILANTAQRGGGEYHLAGDTSTLQIALTSIVAQILEEDTTFAAPAVSVNAFNRTQNLNDIYVSVFRPSTREHWPGNVKKYRVEAGVIIDQSGDDAVNASSGFFKSSAQSFWSDSVDGNDVSLGGAAAELPAHASRKLYTFTGASTSLTASSNAFATSNNDLTDEMLNLGNSGDPSRAELINWARGEDVHDEVPDSEDRRAIGDPLHSRPVAVIYGGSAQNPDAAVFVTTNDGYLHAFDPDDGSELWAFVPQELLPGLKLLFEDSAAASKHYALDGTLQPLVFDENRNGIIDGNDKVLLFFGMRRGGDIYYALDVTDKEAPKLLWVKDGDDYPGLGQTWSTPAPTRVDINGVGQNPQNYVLIFGGGYDTSQDNPGYSTDSAGNGIYMVDAWTGELLWRAGPDVSSDEGLDVPTMENAIPADVRVIDLNGDGFADRLYAADMGGRIFRFDVFNGKSVDKLVTGGMIASLGAAGQGNNPPIEQNRRFYNAPDVSFVNSPQSGTPPFLNIAIGSGYRAHPLNKSVQDRFYSLRDPSVFTQLTKAQFDALTPITDDMLDDVTNDLAPVIPANSRGWKIDLGASGQKVLAEARTFANQIFFTTLTPKPDEPNSCLPDVQNRLYVVNVLDGSPVNNLDGDGSEEALELSDRAQKLNQGGIAPEVAFLFPEWDPADCPPGEQCEPPPPECLVGVEQCDPDFANVPIRTFWRQDGVD